MPFGHPVKAWEDTKTRVLPEGAGYADVDPDVWFTDANAAESAGFHAAREHQSSFVPDAADEGTTILLGRIPTARFGPASQARHLAAGAAPLLAPLGARLDVDTLEDLQAAAELGLGERTAAVAARLGLL